jgi:hypothetical protein
VRFVVANYVRKDGCVFYRLWSNGRCQWRFFGSETWRYYKNMAKKKPSQTTINNADAKMDKTIGVKPGSPRDLKIDKLTGAKPPKKNR